MRVISHKAIVEATRRHPPDGAAAAVEICKAFVSLPLAIRNDLDTRWDTLSREEMELAELLAVLIERFEAGRYQIHLATPRQRLAQLMEDRSLTQADVWRLFGTRAQASEALNGKRGISKVQAKKLAA